MSLLDIYKAKKIGSGISLDDVLGEKFDVVDLGTLTWTRQQVNDSYYVFYSDQIANKSTAYKLNYLCAKYQSVNADRNNLSDKQLGVFNSSTGIRRACIRDDSYTDATTFKTVMSGVYLIYEKEG